MEPAKPAIEQMSLHDLVKEWRTELGALGKHSLGKDWPAELGALERMEQNNPTWAWPQVQPHLEALHALAAGQDGPRPDWKRVQPHLENLQALAMELRRKKALERAKWQP